MPTIITHAIVPLAIGLGLGRKAVPPRLLLAGMAAAVLPDLDVVAFKFGIAYADALGHRGFSHSLAFASFLGLLAACLRRWLRASRWLSFAFVAAAAASHPLLDMLTNGGLGVALWWPWSEQRFFASWRMIEVSPFIHQFFSARGAQVLLSELRWVWLPAMAGSVVLVAMRRMGGRPTAH
ncbi:metal-dependent hydrolase [Pseudoxanthomonas wuyuanensis]|uniref:Inner membrane protein n=1 Tax=Pseudoxanthomonas wuyuanensis TaxID=1073196 RepID=A0A286DGC0_9GAMM|nr:metal-dependent hydrolase [Pseudoxanthomonas wuyuanensis]KAF1719650.1 metal-dependent hydrolase [Pseudoxanthomonas wuyuanensis]SOD57708.1 inner membrane protein [Pseudoxanthomonas wuyuanensis]